MTDLLTHMQQHLLDEYTRALKDGCTRFDLMGGRRSGKTFFILQVLLQEMALGDVISVATMTDAQGRLGAYQDAKDIISGSALQHYTTIMTAPREIRCEGGGRMFFNSYQISERAKGIACDWLYINEANNFTEQQYIDLAASVRKGVFVDRNPNTECWTERNGFTLIHSTWKDNEANLTEPQRQWFADLKAKADAPNATAADIAFYRMYYLGEYADITGAIFTPANIQRRAIDETSLRCWRVYCDPSALVGSDYFAMVLTATDGQKVYVVDTRSENACGRDVMVQQIQEWCKRYDVQAVAVESNGYIGQEFYKYARGAVPRVIPYDNGSNKEARILANYENICDRVIFNDTERVNDYLQQVYAWTGKKNSKEHDDNIDAVNSAFEIHRLKREI